MQPSTKQRLATAADIANLEGHEVIGGEVVEKTAPSGAHGRVQFTIAKGLGPAFDGPGGGGRPGGWWFETECELELGPHEVYLPDIAGWRIERVPMPPRDRPVRIAPDWICEILSPSTASRDLGRKQSGYHQARVVHYWIIDPLNFTLSVLRWREDGYRSVMVAGPGERVCAEPFDAIELDVEALF